MLHNHGIDRSVLQLHPEFRLLTDEELNDVKPFLTENCRTDRIKSYVLRRFGRRLTSKDVNNMKRKYGGDGLPSGGITL